MRYAALVDGGIEAVEVEQSGEHAFVVRVGGSTLTLQAHVTAAGELTLVAPDAVHALHVEALGEVRRVHAAAGHRDVEILDLRRLQLRQARQRATADDGACLLRAPMAGRVVAVLARSGAGVRRGEGLLVLEAMKMENELRAPRDGVVREMAAAVGSVVERGATLCRID